MAVTRPTTIPSWSTDANYPAGSDPWSATPTRVEPDAGDKASGFDPGDKPPAQWFNWLLGVLANWVAYFDDHLLTPEALKRAIPLIPSSGNNNVNDDDEWIAVGAGATPADPHLTSTMDGAVAFFAVPIHPGEKFAIGDGIDVSVNPGAARSTTHRMVATLVQGSVDWTDGTVTWTTPVTHEDNGSTNQQKIALNFGAAYTVLDTDVFYVRLQAGDTAAAFADTCSAMRLRYTSRDKR